MQTRVCSDPWAPARSKPMLGCFPVLRLQASAAFLVLSLALAQGVILHSSQVTPIQDILNAAKLSGVSAYKIDCSKISDSSKYTIFLECNGKRYPTQLLIGYTTLTTLPDSISALKELTGLHAQGTVIGGKLPANLGKLPKLNSLSLSFASVNGPIPASLGNLASLEYMGMTYSGLVGSMPSALGNLAALTEMDVAGNSLQGAVPESFGSLKQLQSLTLMGNQLSGPIPGTCKNLAKLSYLDLSSNKLSGAIPTFLQNPSALSLKRLGLRNNYFSGAANGLCTIANYKYNCLNAETSKCNIGPQRSAKECPS